MAAQVGGLPHRPPHQSLQLTVNSRAKLGTAAVPLAVGTHQEKGGE